MRASIVTLSGDFQGMKKGTKKMSLCNQIFTLTNVIVTDRACSAIVEASSAYPGVISVEEHLCLRAPLALLDGRRRERVQDGVQTAGAVLVHRRSRPQLRELLHALRRGLQFVVTFCTLENV